MPIQQLLNHHYHALAKLYLQARGRSIDDNGGVEWIEAAKTLRRAHAAVTVGTDESPLAPEIHDAILWLESYFGDAHLITVPDGERNYPAVKIVDAKPELPSLDEPGLPLLGMAHGHIDSLAHILHRIGLDNLETVTLRQAYNAIANRVTTTQYFLAHKDE